LGEPKIKSALENRIIAPTQGQLDATVERLRARLSAGTVFSRMRPDSARSPLEMIKEDPQPGDLTSIMAQIPSFTTLQSQINFVHEQRFAYLYCGSSAETEVQLIGASTLLTIKKHLPTPCRFFDAGSGSYGQYAALLCALGADSAGEVVYYAQDYNDDWNAIFRPAWANFLSLSLPAVPEDNFDLAACAHVLQDMAKNPLAVYATIFSLNRVLRSDGICYITVPYKDSIPGILDAIGIAANDAGFHVVDSGCWRLQFTEPVGKHDPLGITTFGRIVMRKMNTVSDEYWRQLVGAAFFRWGYHDLSAGFGVSHESDITEETRLKERDIHDILIERNPHARTFQWVVNRLYSCMSSWERGIATLGIQDIASRIRKQIFDLHDGYVCSRETVPNLDKVCATYFFWLVAWLFYHYRPVTHRSVISTITPPVIECVKFPRDVRVHIDELAPDQVARLIRHLLELCECTGVDIRESFDAMISEGRWPL
jgi:hypothetical protein